MIIKKLIPNLMVEDVNRTAEFYRDVLGFEFVMGVPRRTAKRSSLPCKRTGFCVMR